MNVTILDILFWFQLQMLFKTVSPHQCTMPCFVINTMRCGIAMCLECGVQAQPDFIILNSMGFKINVSIKPVILLAGHW